MCLIFCQRNVMIKTILTIIVGILFFSLKTEALPVSPVVATTTITGVSAIDPSSTTPPKVRKKKLNFLERFVQKATERKVRKLLAKAKDGKIDADRLARQSNLLGWLALASFFIFPLAAIPLGIIAIVNGTTALKNHTSLPRMARTGKITGTIALSLVIAAILIVAIIIASFGFD
jgi:hypothetical protein